MRFSMPFQGKEEAREELCRLALQDGSNRRELCRRHKVQPRILYKWLDRYRQEGVGGLSDRSRRPHHSPCRTGLEMEATVLAVRRENPVWGGRKIAASLVWPAGNQIFAVDWLAAESASGFPYPAAGKGDRARLERLFYAYE